MTPLLAAVESPEAQLDTPAKSQDQQFASVVSA